MDRQLVKTLIDALAASDLTELEYSRDGETLRLVKGSPGRLAGAATTAPTVVAVDPSAHPFQQTVAEPEVAILRAPLYGIVHLQRGPDAPPLVAVGTAVVAGQVLCLIEAMKVFTELRADRDGVVAAILVESGCEVDAGQPLFRLS